MSYWLAMPSSSQSPAKVRTSICSLRRSFSTINFKHFGALPLPRNFPPVLPFNSKDSTHSFAASKSTTLSFDSSSSNTTPQRGTKYTSKQNIGYSGVFWLLLINFTLFVADHVFHLPGVSLLYFHHAQPRWWQYLTSAFCHASWQHLSSNAFMLYVFGKIVEEEEGTFGVISTYVLCAIGATVASKLMQPANLVSLGASGAVFGLFTVSVLCKISFSFRKLLECVILGQFVFQQLLNEARMQQQIWAGGKGLVIAGTQVGHLAHLAGALAGVALVVLLSRLPAPDI